MRRLIEAGRELITRLQATGNEAEGWEEVTELRQAADEAEKAPPGRGTGRTTALLRSLPADRPCFIIVGHAAMKSHIRDLWVGILNRKIENLRVIALERLQTEADHLCRMGRDFRGVIDHTVWNRIETPAQFALLLDFRRRFNIPPDPSM